MSDHSIFIQWHCIIIIIMYSLTCYFSKLEHIAQYKVHTHTHTHTHTRSLISPNKAQTLWCTLDNRTAGKAVPAATLDGSCSGMKKIIWDTLGSTLTECWPTNNIGNSTEVQKRCVSPGGYGCKRCWTMPPLPAVLKWGVQLLTTDWASQQ